MTTIRTGSRSDLPAILAIYNDVIATTTAVYSVVPVSLDNRVAWLADKATRGFPVLVAVEGGDVLGFATFGDFRSWPCYRFNIEHSVHVSAVARGHGIGRALVIALIDSARSLGMRTMVAGIDTDNSVSIAMHQSLGFIETGTLRPVGRKFDRWLDLLFMQRCCLIKRKLHRLRAANTASHIQRCSSASCQTSSNLRSRMMEFALSLKLILLSFGR